MAQRGSDETRSVPVGKRRVVHIAGFEPIEPAVLTRRLSSGLKHFAPVWGATSARTEPTFSADGHAMSWDVSTKGPNWSTDTRYTVLRWDDLMAPYVERPWYRRIMAGYLALLEFARTGTIRRYFKANVRYGLFVIYPVLVLAGCALLAALFAVLTAMAGIPFAPVLAPLLGIAAFVILLRYLGSFFFLDFALSDWSFAADLARHEVTGLDACLDRFAGEVADAAHDSDADEVILSGVSLGAVMMAEAIARALAADPDLCRRRGGRLAFLTVGSSLLKIGLHPAASGLKAAVSRVAGEPSLLWVEYQAKVDLINFYKTNPVSDMGLPATGKPLVKNVRLRRMMSKEEYRRGQRNPLYLHRQFVMPNSRRYFYDFYQILFGPLALAERVSLGKEAVSVFGKEGRLRRSRRPARSPKHAVGMLAGEPLAAGE